MKYYRVMAYYSFGGILVGDFYNENDATKAVQAWIAQAEIDDAIFTIESIFMMPMIDSAKVPSLSAEWLFGGWSSDFPSYSDMVDEIQSYK